MNTIYIVTGCHACYEDWDYWIEKAFTNKADAQLYAAKATELVFKCRLIRKNVMKRLADKYKPGETIQGHSQTRNKVDRLLDNIVKKHLKWGNQYTSIAGNPSFEIEEVELYE